MKVAHVLLLALACAAAIATAAAFPTPTATTGNPLVKVMQLTATKDCAAVGALYADDLVWDMPTAVPPATYGKADMIAMCEQGTFWLAPEVRVRVCVQGVSARWLCAGCV